MKLLRESTLETLDQVKQIISACDCKSYNQPSAHSTSGIGRHVRHILDHFVAVKEGAASGLINYNARNRDSDVENDPEIAFQIIDEIVVWLSDESIKDRELNIETEVSVSETQNMQMPSTLSREICYLINHTIHHVAYANLVAGQLGLHINKDHGVAPGTATYLRSKYAAG